MIDKILIFLCYYSRKITVWVMGIYFLIMLLLKGHINNETISKLELPISFLFIGFFIGLNLMAWIVKYLNSDKIKQHPTFKRLKSKDNSLKH